MCIIIYPGHPSLDVAIFSRFVAIHDQPIFRSDIRSRTTSYLHETSEEIINQAHPKYSVYCIKSIDAFGDGRRDLGHTTEVTMRGSYA